MDNLEAAMVTIVEKMATCEFYAQIYDESLRVRLATSTTTDAFDEGLDTALKDLYAAVRAFLDMAKEYFDPENSGKYSASTIPSCCCILMSCVYSHEEDYEPLKAIFGHHAAPDPRYLGQGEDCGKVRRNGYHGKDPGFVLISRGIFGLVS